LLRAAGAALLLAGSGGLGLAAVRQLDRRVAALRSLTQALELLERELDFHLPPMGELLLAVAQRCQQPAARFLQSVGERLGELDGRPLSQLWGRAVRELLPALKPCDLETLDCVGAVLGRYDGEGQRHAIAAARDRLGALLADAVQERRRQGRVYGAVSVTAGIFLTLLLL
jgi:stage III sporulation protein AB